jgi:hypothetical protein
MQCPFPPMPATLQTEADVLVIGGGTAGTIAALQAARSGAHTVLIERGPQLGGTTTTGGVAYPGLFHAWERQIIAGIGWELVTRAVELDGGTMPDFTVRPPRHSMHQVRLNGPLYAALAEEACLQAGVELCYYEFPLGGAPTDTGWHLAVAGSGVRRSVQCKQLIDCTGGADVVGLLGYPRQREEVIQPGTLHFRLEGYDVKAMDPELVEARYQQALADGTLQPGDLWDRKATFVSFLSSHGANHVFGADSSTSVTQTAANLAGRQMALRLLRFVRSLPGGEKARLQLGASETAVRESYRLLGETVITVEDYCSGRLFEDAICWAFYPVDVHDENGVTPEPLQEGVVPSIPFSALVPKGSRNLLAAGRCVSSDRLANSALRVQAPCMAMGQAVGAAAALAAKAGISPTEVALDDIKTELRAQGALVP